MRILNFGSLNIDHVYQMTSFVRAGETLSAGEYDTHVGGKGLNQSVALAKAGACVYHGGKIGKDGLWLKDFLGENNVDCQFVMTDANVATGHAIIQVVPWGENCIIIYGGSNRAITKSEIDDILGQFKAGEYLLLQNEISNIDYIIREAHRIGMKVILNPSPITEELVNTPELKLLDWVILNETEAEAFSGESDPDKAYPALKKVFPAAEIILTLGSKGSMYEKDGNKIEVPAYNYGPAVDTTAAGDTFTGYFFAGIMEGKSVQESMNMASKAAAITVTGKGAAESIPHRSQI